MKSLALDHIYTKNRFKNHLNLLHYFVKFELFLFVTNLHTTFMQLQQYVISINIYKISIKIYFCKNFYFSCLWKKLIFIYIKLLLFILIIFVLFVSIISLSSNRISEISNRNIANRPSRLFARPLISSISIVIGKTAGSTHSRDLGSVEPFAIDLNRRRRRSRSLESC